MQIFNASMFKCYILLNIKPQEAGAVFDSPGLRATRWLTIPSLWLVIVAPDAFSLVSGQGWSPLGRLTGDEGLLMRLSCPAPHLSARHNSLIHQDSSWAAWDSGTELAGSDPSYDTNMGTGRAGL